MTEQSAPDQAAEMRKRAEEIARGKAAQLQEDLEALSPAETGKILHELRVHQIELELQNEELRRAQVELDAVRARYFDLYDLAPVGYVTTSKRGRIIEANLTAVTLLCAGRRELADQPITRFILGEDQDIYYRHRKELFETSQPQNCELRMLKNDGTAFWAHFAATTAQEDGGPPVCRMMISDISERKQIEETLQKAFAQIKTLRGIVPICASCKKIRDDKGYWSQVEEYVRAHSEAEFTHCVCPECMLKLYSEYMTDDGKKLYPPEGAP